MFTYLKLTCIKVTLLKHLMAKSYFTMVMIYMCRWYKFIEGTSKKQAVTLDDRIKQVSGTLIIREAKVEDSGKYLCVVNNSVGGESVETVLTVTGKLILNLLFILLRSLMFFNLKF